MNVMQIVSSLHCGGLERLTIDLAHGLNKEKYRTFICCLNGRGELAEQAEAKGIRIIEVGKKNAGIDIFLPFRLAKIMRTHSISIVHTHNMGPLIYGTLAAKLAQVPVVINTRHGREKKKTYGFIWNMNDAVVAISEDARKRLLKFNHFNHAKSKVIYNGVRIEQFDNQGVGSKEKLLGVDKDCRVIGTVSRLSEEKDQFSLIRAFKMVESIEPRAGLIFVGDGLLKSKLTALANELGVKDKVVFLGFRGDVNKVMQSFDIFALSSLQEGISLSLLEAMACSKPIVATNVGGNPEVVVDGKTGILVPPKDPQTMADAIIKILQDKELARRMGAAGRKRVEEHFSLDRMVGEYEKVYEECLFKKGEGRWFDFAHHERMKEEGREKMEKLMAHG